MSEPTQQDSNRRWDLLWNAQLGTRYHMHLQRFYARMGRAVTVISLVSSSAAFAFFFQQEGQLAQALTCLVALVQILDLVVDTKGKTLVHASLKQRYLHLEAELLGVLRVNEEQSKGYQERRMSIELEEPPIIDVLIDKCHNELAKVHGLKSHQETIPTWNRVKAWWYS